MTDRSAPDRTPKIPRLARSGRRDTSRDRPSRSAAAAATVKNYNNRNRRPSGASLAILGRGPCRRCPCRGHRYLRCLPRTTKPLHTHSYGQCVRL